MSHETKSVDFQTLSKIRTFQKHESEARSYCRSFPAVFTKARGSFMTDMHGQEYLDFLSGAGSLNYGHNDPEMKSALVDYLMEDGIGHSLDMHSAAKAKFIDAFNRYILKPRGLQYRIQFTGPTGTNSVESAIKLARKITGRKQVIAFTNGFHGVTQGALACTANTHHRSASASTLCGVDRYPYDGYMGEGIDTSEYLEKMLTDKSSGQDAPAAILVEGVQGEGGLNVASMAWLKNIARIARKAGAMLILDEIQAGVGRAGQFFSFENAGIEPDLICLSKSLSGMGLPMAVTLIRPDLDFWKPGEHNGTFRGNCHAFITAATAIEKYWSNPAFERGIAKRAEIVTDALKTIFERNDNVSVGLKGRGMMQGIEMVSGELADQVVAECFKEHLIIETCGNEGQVVKVFAALNIELEDLRNGLNTLARAVAKVSAQADKAELNKQGVKA
ncbi:MAG TPA: diaminobutyrate--2-oxoglutarate transaminase [Limnobacter sp.]|uniref:diaminobutyrate--2-oxoglutarate transaminase n=1 Tax=Limnobacter sp. TaxID=2003368 RepID=UPI002E312B80|nr:diaminobutyrate--2-oxoglutarate transaminase [Limnobacter sp.]HEX5485969.1 diaminobutyrate--2-oxoglutarate transaminase [Limnobacter sp.]